MTAYEHPGAHGEAVPTSPSHRPGMVALQNYLLHHYPGTTNLGLYNNRSVRGGTSTSLHAVSRAADVGWPNRATCDHMLGWLVNHATLLGIQALHDYNRTAYVNGHTQAHTWGHDRGWHWARVGSYGGHWIHVELNIAAAQDANLMGRLAGHQTPAPVAHKFPNHTLHVGSHNADVALLQVGLRNWHTANSAIPDPGNPDGKFGPRTEASLKAWQRIYGNVEADGRYGPATHWAWVVVSNYLEALAHH